MSAGFKKTYLCLHCGGVMPDGRVKLHPACREPYKEAQLDARRHCGKCRKVKPAGAFSNDVSRADGKYPYCKSCQNINNNHEKILQDANAPLNGKTCPMCDTQIRGPLNRKYCSDKCKDRVGRLKRRFGMDVKDYRRLVADAKGRCPICLKRCHSWQLDHNHETLLSTGVVCTTCNVGLLAYSGHDADTAQRLADYLRNTPADRLGIVAIAPENRPGTLHERWGHKR